MCSNGQPHPYYTEDSVEIVKIPWSFPSEQVHFWQKFKFAQINSHTLGYILGT